jgi:hypothetical protein
MEYLGAWGTLIHEKNLKSKISCQTPFKVSKVCGSDIRGIPGGPEDGREAVPRPPFGQPSLAPLPQGE